MDFKEYLRTSCPVDLAIIAAKMWPTNAAAKTYLSMKLNDKRPWTEKDNALAKKVLNEIGIELSNL